MRAEEQYQEIRLNEDGSLDEIVINDASIHIEQMADNSWWIGITRGEGTDSVTVHVNLWTVGKGDRPGARIHARVLDEGIGCAVVRQSGEGYMPVTPEEVKEQRWQEVEGDA